MDVMEEPTDPDNMTVSNPPQPAPEGPPVPPPPLATAQIPAAGPYPPGYGPGTAPPPGPPPGAPPGYGWTWGPAGPASPPPAKASRLGGWFRRAVRSVLVAWLVAAALAATVIGLSVALASSSPSVATRAPFAPSATPFGRGGFPGGGNGLFGSAVVGTVASVSSTSFTVSARSGTTVTVDEQSSTTYYNGTTQATSSVVTKGATVAVQGTRSNDTVTATRVTVLPAGGFFGGSGPSAPAA